MADHKVIRFSFPCSKSEQAIWKEAAERDDAASLAEWIRERLHEAAAGRDPALAELRDRIAKLEETISFSERAYQSRIGALLAFARRIRDAAQAEIDAAERIV